MLQDCIVELVDASEELRRFPNREKVQPSLYEVNEKVESIVLEVPSLAFNVPKLVALGNFAVDCGGYRTVVNFVQEVCCLFRLLEKILLEGSGIES